MKKKKIKIHRYCCVPSVALDIFTNKGEFLSLMSRIWDSEKKNGKQTSNKT